MNTFFAFYSAAVTPYRDLQHASRELLMKDKLLLVQGVQRSSCHCRFGLGHAPLATHQVHLNPRGWQYFGSWFTLKSTTSYDLNFQVSSSITKTELDFSKGWRSKDLSSH